MWADNQFASVLLIGRADYLEKNPQIIQQWIDSHFKTINWINSNKVESEQIIIQFLKKTLGKSLPEKIVSKSLANIEITPDPIMESIYIFAERADSLGYLGRQGYDLTGIFYEVKVPEI